MAYKTTVSNGVSYGVKYTVQASDVDTAAVAEVVTLVVTAGCTSNGNVTITLPSLAAVDIAVTTDADLTTEVATLIRAGTFTGWTTGGTNSTVTFTRNVAGVVSGTPLFAPAATGVTATITISTPGAAAYNGHVEFDFRKGNSSYRYPLVASVVVTDASGVVTNPADLAITYPSDGRIDVEGTLLLGSIIHLVANRARTNV